MSTQPPSTKQLEREGNMTIEELKVRINELGLEITQRTEGLSEVQENERNGPLAYELSRLLERKAILENQEKK